MKYILKLDYPINRIYYLGYDASNKLTYLEGKEKAALFDTEEEANEVKDILLHRTNIIIEKIEEKQEKINE